MSERKDERFERGSLNFWRETVFARVYSKLHALRVRGTAGMPPAAWTVLAALGVILSTYSRHVLDSPLCGRGRRPSLVLPRPSHPFRQATERRIPQS